MASIKCFSSEIDRLGTMIDYGLGSESSSMVPPPQKVRRKGKTKGLALCVRVGGPSRFRGPCMNHLAELLKRKFPALFFASVDPFATID